jgi:8-oxo-dGTP pyrophosphatase MutT (NUDIX family)
MGCTFAPQTGHSEASVYSHLCASRVTLTDNEPLPVLSCRRRRYRPERSRTRARLGTDQYPGAWQFPQSGLKPDEDPLRAAFREITEETAIPHADLELIAAFPEPLVYELSAAARNSKTRRGQVQYWFLFRFHGADSSIDVQSGGEFRSWMWTPFAVLLQQVAEFRSRSTSV